MEVIHGLENIKERHLGAVVMLGFFDGFHRGHQALVHEARRIASSVSRQTPILAYTFDRHPMEIVNPTQAPCLLSTLGEKIGLAEKLQVDYFLVGKFDKSLSLLPPSRFIQDLVAGTLRPKVIVVGFNYRYGKGHRGDASALARDAGRLHLSVAVVSPVIVEGTPVSSTRIRKLLYDGNVEKARNFLGRPYFISGRVIPGKGRGKTLGVPTANLEIPALKLIPKPGIYAGFAHWEQKRCGSLISIGDCPTFQGKDLVVEAHLLDFKGNLYGKPLRIEFTARRRDQKKFPSPQELALAMKEDVSWGQKFMKNLTRR